MAYIHTLTKQYPVSELDIRYANPNTSFPTPFVPPDEYAWVFPAPHPSYDSATEQVREIAPVVVNNHYEQRWEVISKFTEYTDEQGVVHTVAEQEAAAITEDTALKTTQTIARYTEALTALLDSEAQSKRYDNRITCSLRAGYAGPFQAEGTAFAIWMDTCNALGYTIMQEVIDQIRPMPTIEEFLAEMPEMVWPT